MPLKDRLAQQPVVGTAMAVQERYRDDAADQLAAAISFFAFLSVFPLLALALAAAGFVLDDPQDQVELTLTLTEAVPGFDAVLSNEDGAPDVAALLENVVARRGTIGAIGLVTLLVAGLKVIAAAMVATRVVFRGAVLLGLRARVRQLLAMLGLGLLALAAAGGSSIAGARGGLLPPVAAFLFAFAIAFALDFGLFLGAYTLLSPTSSMSIRQLVPGAVLAAVGWALLKVVGASYVGNQVEGANALYGALGGVLGLLLLFYLAGRLYLYGAELSAVLAERRDGSLHRPDEAGPDATEQERTTQRSGRSAVPSRARPNDPGSGRAGASPRDPAPGRAGARPGDPGPGRAAPTIRQPTRERLVAADDTRHAVEATRDRGVDARRAVAFALAATALAAAWRFLGPDRE